MRRLTDPVVLVLLVLLAVSAASAQNYPSRKPGLWEMKVSSAGLPTQIMSQCIDASTDAAMQKMGQNMSDSNCSKNESSRDGSNYVNDSVCTLRGTTMTSKSVFSGDFNNSYKAEVNSKFDPPLMGKTESRTVIEATFKGACKPGQKPGDVIMPGGVTMNINDIGKGYPATQGKQ